MIENLPAFYEEAIRKIGEGIGPEEFVQMTYSYFHVPIIVVDEAFKLLAYANEGSFEDPYWEDLVKHGAARSETITEHYLKDGYIDSISGSREATYVDWGVSLRYPQTCGPIFVNQELEGFVSLLFLDPAMKDDMRHLNTVICQLLGILLQTSNYRMRIMQNPIRQVFARKFFDPENLREPLDVDSYRPHVSISPEYRVAVIGTFAEDKMLSEHVRGRIRAIYPNVIYLNKQNSLYMLMESLSDSSDAATEQRLRQILGPYMLHAGISQRFSGVKDRALYIEQAESAFKTGMWIAPEEVVFSYKHYFSSILLLPAIRSMAMKNLIPDELVTLRLYDKQNETDYISTLRAYLYERNDLNRAAAHLHIHRNTLRYRLEKICQLLKIDPDDPETAIRLEIGFGIGRFVDRESTVPHLDTAGNPDL